MEQIRTELESSGVLLATIDMPDRRMNVFSEALMDALDALMDRVDADAAIRGVVLTSGKPTFLAGADLSMVRGFTDTAKHATVAELTALCGRLGRQFVRLEAQNKPWVAAVNGLALGGGLELAMACRARIVVDDPRAQLGLPEVRWGLLPGAGGTQRVTRLIGADAGLRMLLEGKPIGPTEAVQAGLFGKAVPASALLDEARALVVSAPYDPRQKFAHLDDRPEGDRRAIATRFGVSHDDLLHYPAYGAIIDSVLEGAGKPLAEASAIEMKHFLTLMIDPVAGRMVRALYLDKLRAERAITVPKGTPGALPEEIPLVELGAAPIEGAHVVLSPPGPYGRVLELVGVPEDKVIPLASFAASQHAMPWRTPGPTSLLHALRGRPLDEQARIAAVVDVDPAFLDVAACVSGVSPAWSGGPISYAKESA